MGWNIVAIVRGLIVADIISNCSEAPAASVNQSSRPIPICNSIISRIALVALDPGGAEAVHHDLRQGFNIEKAPDSARDENRNHAYDNSDLGVSCQSEGFG